ncbi:MmgE/PrpD family protein [Kribbella shirazensis]|uniref:2-methylcitrate dehydratase PrpD n=1 Tax=Kribbella shirazensis TaxID=1105143 RepID=A0A7X5VHQ8_9ACTN|nr:MmgE/PrpD family protein [Kribbella shirazensis]NIK61422.1 2-methylcitrate dehydratase PrpD [Kribbella shirazensis]
MTGEAGFQDTPTISWRLADYLVGLRYEDIPELVTVRAKELLVNQLGVAFRGLASSGVQQAVQVAHELSGVNGGCSVIGHRGRVGLLEAVFVNSFMMSNDGLEDGLMPQGINPGVVTHPVALALGEQQKASGRELLTAIVVGYDVLARLADPEWSWDSDMPDRLVLYRPAHVLAVFGAAACAARMLKLSREQAMHALGHAGQAGMGVIEAAPEQLIAQHPLLARNGVMAALIAKAGLAAAPTIIEGEHGVFRSYFLRGVTDWVAAGLTTLGAEFAIAQTEIKRHATSTMDVIPIELTLRLLEAHSLTASSVATVEVVVADERLLRELIREDTLARSEGGRMSRLESLRFQIAGAAADRASGAGRCEQPSDAELRAMLDKLVLRYEPDRSPSYARVEIVTVDGERHSAEREAHVQPSFDWSQWLASGARAGLSEAQLNGLADCIRNLEHLPDVSELMTFLVPAQDNRHGHR